MSDKRIIEEPASEEIFHDDWLVKDSPLNETTKIQASVFMALIADQAKVGMVPYAMLATEWTALTTYYNDQVVIYNGELYRAKDTNVSPTFNPSAWTKISFDTLYRTTLADVKNSICEEWSTSGEYTLNDCAIHDDKLYKCVADTATVGTWVSSEWELVSIYEMIQNLPKSASDVTYDNTESGLESENVQDALDEVAETITELSNTTEVTGTASGAIATFTDGADAPMKSLVAEIEPVQDLHGYDNPWPGGGGKNKCDLSAFTHTGITTDTGVVTTANSRLFSVHIPIKSNTAYTLSIAGSKNGEEIYPNRIIYFDNTNTFIERFVPTKAQIATFTTLSNAIYLQIDLRTNSLLDIEKSDVSWIQLEEGSTATSYAPYSNVCPIIGWDEAVVTVADDAESPTTSHEYTIDLNGTRYGGTLDATNGTMTVDRVYVDMGTLDWTKASSGRHNTTISDGKYALTNDEVAYGISNQYKVVSASTISNNDSTFCYGVNGRAILQVNDSRYNGEDATAFKAHMNGVQLVYELATPITVQLAPQPVKSLEGTNNIFANCGDINNVEYVRNLNITINDLLSRING